MYNKETTKIRPLVLGTAVNYNWEQLAAFVLSCKRHIPEVKIVLFVSNIDLDTIEKLEKENVKVIIDSFNKYPNFVGWRLPLHQIRLKLSIIIAKLITNGLKSDENEPYVNAFSSVVIQRFYRYLRFIEIYGKHYSHIILTDTRDVIFQSNPFPLNGLHLFGEKNEKIGESHFAKRWFQLSYGTKTWKELGNKPLLNVGTTLGDTSSVLNYLSLVTNEFNRILSFFWGADTSVHNFIAYKKVHNPVINKFGQGVVITLHGVKLNQLILDKGKILNSNGIPFSIVHQYDRVKDLILTDLMQK